jgi:hypothetical protein
VLSPLVQQNHRLGCVNRRGVSYDVGRVLGMNWRPDFDPRVVHREIEIIKNDLHCNAIRICGRDLGRLMTAAVDALEVGLEVWLSPELWNKDPAPTLAYIGEAAVAAERLRRRWPDRLVFSVASEATLFVKGIVPGRTITKRVANLFQDVKSGNHIEPLKTFLVRANDTARKGFHGQVTYAALPFEPVDWSLFDIVGVDHYRDARIRDRYVEMIEPLFSFRKPVVVTEFGMRSYQGAESSGSLGFGIVDNRSQFLHHFPLVGPFIRPRLKKGLHIRDEALQSREIAETLAILDAAGVDGAFVCTFVDPIAPFSEEAPYDLDMSSLSLVKTYEHGHGTTYPDMAWEPKDSFRAVAGYYAGPITRVD